MTTINWVLLDIKKPQLTGGSKGGLPLISATLAIAGTNNPEYFKLADNTLQNRAPRKTPVQVSWALPNSPLKGGVRLAFTGVNLDDAPNGKPASQEFPTAIASSEPFCKAETNCGLSLMMWDTPTLTLVDCNDAPPNSKPPFIYEYSIVFLGSDGNYYLFDPPLENQY